MVKVILKGSPACQWDINGSMKDGGTVLELCSTELKTAEKNNLIEVYVEKPKTQKYTKEELFGWNKDRQVKELKKLGINPAKREAGRVKQLLEAQK